MEEEEIELWYEQEKEKLSELYRLSIEKGMKLEDREKKFNRAMERLTEEYDRKHTRLQARKERQKRRAKSRSRFSGRVGFFIRVFGSVFSFFGRGIRRVFSTKYAHAHYKASMFRIRYGYKIIDSSSNAFRPLFYWYVRYVQRFIIALVRPFILLGRFFRKKALQAKDLFMNLASVSWEWTKKIAKYTASGSAAVYKSVSGKCGEISKRYHEGYAKKVQEQLDKKQARKEAKEKKKKEKEEAKKRREAGKNGETLEADGNAEDHAQKTPAEAPDAENTT